MQVFTINVKPQARLDEVKLTSPNCLDVSTTRPAKEGKANKHVIKLLARYLKVSPSKLIVSKGERWNTKTILLID